MGPRPLDAGVRSHIGLKKGHVEFSLDGEKLHGRWHLVRMHRRPGESKNNWLLIKGEDEAARGAGDPDILEEMPRSVLSGRSMEENAQGKGKTRVWHSNRSVKDNVTAGATGDAKRNVTATGTTTTPRQPDSRSAKTKSKATVKSKPTTKSKSKPAANSRSKHGEVEIEAGGEVDNRRPDRKPKRPAGHGRLPEFVPPSLASLRAAPPSGSGWVHEIKFDGYRMQARLDGGDVRLLTRKGLDWTDKFRSVADALTELPTQAALIDGEIVVENDRGISDFSMLQATLKSVPTTSLCITCSICSIVMVAT